MKLLAPGFDGDLPRLSRRGILLLGPLVILLLFSSCRCPPDFRQPARQIPAGQSVTGQPATGETGSNLTASPPTPQPRDTRIAGPPLTGCLDACLAELQALAHLSGFAAELVCPDTSRDAQFLVVAEDQAAACQINGFFYWLSDPGDDGQASLFLVADRLFAEKDRDAAAANGLFSMPDVTGLLENSLQLVMQDSETSELMLFLLDCYRRDFRCRLERQDPGANQCRTFRRIEVTYEPSVYCSFAFRYQTDFTPPTLGFPAGCNCFAVPCSCSGCMHHRAGCLAKRCLCRQFSRNSGNTGCSGQPD